MLQNREEILNNIFEVKNETDFNTVALSVFHYQYINNLIYKAYVNSLNRDVKSINHYTEIPFLPIEFFKTKDVVCSNIKASAICFTSSGTTGQITSKHWVNDVAVYEKSFLTGFSEFYGSTEDYCILALLPNYLERSGSSLVYMFDKLIKNSKHKDSGFYLNNINELVSKIIELKTKKQKTILLGVTYALLDLAEKGVELSEDFIVMETGGMKGKRKEMIKEELYAVLVNGLKVNSIHSEYGMTELLSQAYSKGMGVFRCPSWMKILVRDVNDPFTYVKNGKNGGINVIDLANLDSCAFIETKDLGKLHTDNSFEIIGRFDNSDIRGCNLMIG